MKIILGDGRYSCDSNNKGTRYKSSCNASLINYYIVFKCCNSTDAIFSQDA